MAVCFAAGARPLGGVTRTPAVCPPPPRYSLQTEDPMRTCGGAAYTCPVYTWGGGGGAEPRMGQWRTRRGAVPQPPAQHRAGECPAVHRAALHAPVPTGPCLRSCPHGAAAGPRGSAPLQTGPKDCGGGDGPPQMGRVRPEAGMGLWGLGWHFDVYGTGRGTAFVKETGFGVCLVRGHAAGGLATAPGPPPPPEVPLPRAAWAAVLWCPGAIVATEPPCP